MLSAQSTKEISMVKIYEADPVWSITNREGFKELDKLLSYVTVFWRPGPMGKKKRDSYIKHLIQPGNTPDEFLFMSGLMPRVLTYLDKKGIDYEYSSDVEMVEYDEPKVPGIVFRDYQQSIIELMIEEGRGVVKAATASGKSFMILGIISAFSKENVLLLVHTKILVNQLVDDLEKYNFGPIGVYSGKTKEIKRITVATIQSYKKIALDYFDFWQVVIIDESLAGSMRITTDKGQISIRKIVEDKLKVQVLTKNEKTNQLEWKKIVKYHKHPPKSEMLEIKHEKGTLKVTENHEVFTENRGWVIAGELKEGDLLILNKKKLPMKNSSNVCHTIQKQAFLDGEKTEDL